MLSLWSLLEAWKNVEIASRLARFLAGVAKGILPTGKNHDPSSVSDVRDGFFNDQVFYGDTVHIVGRLSQYCPVYFPIAYASSLASVYTARIKLATRSVEGMSMGGRINPPLTSTHIQSATGSTLAFVFDETTTETPRLVSMLHPDRTTMNPFPRLTRGLPVIVDPADEGNLDEIVEVRARIARLDERIAQVIGESSERLVRGYYGDFYRADRYPNAGYVLDARRESGGSVSRTKRFAPFHTSLGVELAVGADSDEAAVEEIAHAAMKGAATGPVSRCQPAYYTPGGYRIVQFGSEDASVHVAPTLGVFSIAVRADITQDVSDVVKQQLTPLIEAVATAVRALPEASPKILYASDDRLSRVATASMLR